MLLRTVILIASLLLMVGCSRRSSPEPVTREGIAPETSTSEVSTLHPAPSAPAVPTVYPTETVFPPPQPTETRPPSSAEPTQTPIDYSQIAVEMRYTIPQLELSRHLLADVSNHILLTDETTGQSRRLSDQTGIVIQLQQALPRFELEDLPEGCTECVWLEYDVPLVGESDSGWLRNVQLLASVENYTAIVLGPHFPPGTIAGLHRSATPYQVAHTVAITADEQLWSWTAIDAEVSGSQAGGGAALAQFLESVNLDSLPDSLNATCPQGAAFETLFLRSGDEEKLIRITCPEFSLPASLLPVYLPLDRAADRMLEGVGIPHPQPIIPLTSLLYFQRDDGARLSLHDDDLVVATDVVGSIYTSTLTSTLAISLTNVLSHVITPTISITETAALTETAVISATPSISRTITISLVETLVDSGSLRPGLNSFMAGETANILVVRASDALYEAAWDDRAPPAIRELVGLLEELLKIMLERAKEEARSHPTPTPATEATAEPPS